MAERLRGTFRLIEGGLGENRYPVDNYLSYVDIVEESECPL